MSSAAVLDLQTVSLERAAPCVRLLNLNGTVGCATPSAGVTVPLASATYGTATRLAASTARSAT